VIINAITPEVKVTLTVVLGISKSNDLATVAALYQLRLHAFALALRGAPAV
jgi:hypothetical protein